MARKKDWLLGMGIVLICLVIIFSLLNYLSDRSSYQRISISGSGEKIALVELDGVIYESRSVARQFKTYGRQSSIKAIVFRINSPGGGIVPSQEIYNAVRRVRDAGKPVVVSMATVAASGGYYVALGADTIMANPGTTTGSIGVIVEFMNSKELMNKIGLSFDVVKSGRYKDIGNPNRDMTPAEKQLLQDYVDNAFGQFVETVAFERQMDPDLVKKYADGRIFTGQQALTYGLVDVNGDFQDAIDLAAAMAGIDGKPEIIKERKRRSSVYDLLFDKVRGILHLSNGMQLQYRMVW